MKHDFDRSSPPESIYFPLRWPYEDKGMVTRDPAAINIAIPDISALAVGRPSEGTLGGTPVYVIAKGTEPFMTFLNENETSKLLKLTAGSGLLAYGQRADVKPAGLRFFEDASLTMINPLHIHRMFDGPEQHNDDLLFRIVFDNNNALNVSTRDGEFDSEAEVKAANIPVPPDETPRQKWFREADEGTAIGNAMEARIKNQRVQLNKFLDTVAEAAPQLYRVEGTKFALFTRPGDIDNILVFTQQTDGARITFKKSEGEVYGHPVDKTAYFTSPENAIWGVERLKQQVQARPQAGTPQPPRP